VDDIHADFKTMYLRLFNTITDVIDILQKAQAETEAMYTVQGEPTLISLDPPAELKD
jgi:hypothetical protein